MHALLLMSSHQAANSRMPSMFGVADDCVAGFPSGSVWTPPRVGLLIVIVVVCSLECSGWKRKPRTGSAYPGRNWQRFATFLFVGSHRLGNPVPAARTSSSIDTKLSDPHPCTSPTEAHRNSGGSLLHTPNALQAHQVL